MGVIASVSVDAGFLLVCHEFEDARFVHLRLKDGGGGGGPRAAIQETSPGPAKGKLAG